MTLSEMHVWFRQFAQQMGMQNVRALLPEQIDLLINTSITDTVNQIITQNIGVTNDRIISDNSKIGQINALKTLYTVKSFNIFDYSRSKLSSIAFGPDEESQETLLTYISRSWSITWVVEKYIRAIYFTIGNGSSYDIDTTGKTIRQVVDAIQTVIYSKIQETYTDDNNPVITTELIDDRFMGQVIKFSGVNDSIVSVSLGTPPAMESADMIPSGRRFTLDSDGVYKGLIRCNSIGISYLYLVDFAIDYKKSNTGIINNMVDYVINGFTSKYFPVRLIDDAFLADTLNDFILAPRLRSPILTVNADNYDLYFDKFIKVGNGFTLDNGLVPYTLRISYIAKPNKVEYRLDKGYDTNIDCNLPDYLHEDILKHAVDLYRASITGNLLGQQAQDQAQQREIVRNNAVPSNGYQNNQQ